MNQKKQKSKLTKEKFDGVIEVFHLTHGMAKTFFADKKGMQSSRVFKSLIPGNYVLEVRIEYGDIVDLIYPKVKKEYLRILKMRKKATRGIAK